MKNHMIELEQYNHLMKLEKEIVVDRFKGIFEAICNINKPFQADFKLTQEFCILANKGQAIFSETQNELKQIKQVLHDRDYYMNECLEIHEKDQDNNHQREKIVKIFKEKNNSMQAEISRLLEDKQILSEKLLDAEKKYQTCFEEFCEYKRKVKNKFSLVDVLEEKFCRNCQRTFYEKDNFNWSCRTHVSSFSEGFYWCCGSGCKDAPGCVVSKHTSSEGEREISSNEELERVRLFCTACKECGHRIDKCDKDPNFRSDYDVNDEMERIKKLQKNISKISNNFLNYAHQMENINEEDFSDISKLKSEISLHED